MSRAIIERAARAREWAARARLTAILFRQLVRFTVRGRAKLLSSHRRTVLRGLTLAAYGHVIAASPPVAVFAGGSGDERRPWRGQPRPGLVRCRERQPELDDRAERRRLPDHVAPDGQPLAEGS